MAGKREIRATSVAVVFLLLCVVTFSGVFAFYLSAAIDQTRSDLETRSEAGALTIATNAGWMAQVAQQTLRRVDAALGPNLAADEEILQTAVEALPPEVEVYIIDAEAHTLFSTVDGATAVNVADREYFTALQQGASFYTSGLLVSRITGDQIFVFSRRVERGGAFAGAIMVSFSDSVLETFFRALELEPGSTVSLIRRDGELMARFPRPEGPVSLAEHPLITEHLPNGEFGTYFSDVSPIDGTSRVVSYRAVPGTEILALASIATDQTWRDLNAAVTAMLIIVAPIIVGLGGVGLWIVLLLRRDARRRSELEAAQETNVLLFREIHHRVKNNLQSVQSLVRMQEMPPNVRIDLQSRLSAMAAMHEHIYRNDRYEDIDAHDLVPVVVNEVIHAYGADVAVHYSIDHIAIDRDHATPISLLLSELITNALKYAFVDGREGRIEVSISRLSENRCRLVVADNGPGMGDMPDTPTSMGLRLIRGVVSQMGGTYRFTSDSGTRFEAELALASSGHHHPVRAATTA